jgi:spore cortex biosynthesis protein YabQ
MMSDVIREETVVFLVSVLHGGLLTFGYDLLRSLRRTFQHSPAAVAVEDFLFWMTAGFLTFCLAFFRTDGVIRGYVAAGMAIGAVLYHFACSALVLRLLCLVLSFGKRVVTWLVRILSEPAKKMCRLLKKSIEFTRKRGYNENK